MSLVLRLIFLQQLTTSINRVILIRINQLLSPSSNFFATAVTAWYSASQLLSPQSHPQPDPSYSSDSSYIHDSHPSSKTYLLNLLTAFDFFYPSVCLLQKCLLHFACTYYYMMDHSWLTCTYSKSGPSTSFLGPLPLDRGLVSHSTALTTRA